MLFKGCGTHPTIQVTYKNISAHMAYIQDNGPNYAILITILLHFPKYHHRSVSLDMTSQKCHFKPRCTALYRILPVTLKYSLS